MNHMTEQEILAFRKKLDIRSEQWEVLGRFFRIFGDGTRLRILTALSESSLCVTDLCGVLEMTASAVSHQLRMLKDQRLVKSRKDGQHVIYTLDDEHIGQILSIGRQHVSER